MRTLLSALALSAIAVQASLYSVSFDGSAYSISVDGTTTGTVTKNDSAIAFSGISVGIGTASGALNLTRPLAYITSGSTLTVDLTAANLSIYSYNTAATISFGTSTPQNVFTAPVVNATNYALFYDDSIAGVRCAPILDNTFGNYSCFDNLALLVGQFIDTYSVGSSSSPRRINFTSSSIVPQQISSMITIALFRLNSAEQQASIATTVHNAMTTRGKNLQSFAGVLYVTVILELIVLSVVAAYFIAFIPVEFLKKKYAMLLNFVALLVLGVILCATAGLIGYFVIQGLLLLIVVLGPLLKCLCCKDTDHDPWGGETVSSDASCCQKMTNWRTVLLLLAGVIILFDIIWLFSDNIPTYEVYSRPEAAVITEYQPYLIVKSLSAVYAYKNIAENPLQVNKLFQVATKTCGSEFTKTLTSDSDKKSNIYTSWIQKYSVNMSLFVPSDYLQYNSVNDWFVRKINSSYRPISFPADVRVVTSPADCRTVGFQRINGDQEIWLKGDPFTVSQLVNSDTVVNEFSSASLVISRLSPQDYHRFHAPVTGYVRRMFSVNGQYQSVNSDAVSSGNEVLVKNVRTVVILDVPVNGQNTTVLFVAVGANCVGSVVFSVKEGDSITKGDNIGYFQFGGSTVVTIYQQNRVSIADDIQRNSLMGVETYVNVGDVIARLK
jgi:phosphatidylserine decarboxylase precursor